jgi:hypothetical protein
VILACMVAAALTVPALADAGIPAPVSASASKAHKRHHVGGRVRLAWPYSKGPSPADPLSRWLARQSGPVCSKAHKKSHKRCPKLRRRGHKTGRKASTTLAVPSVDRGPKHSDPSPMARIAADVNGDPGTSDPLALTRSYEIPKDDPAYERLLNWTWTYDSAATAASFVGTGDQKQAMQLLDQLSALQYKDGSIDIAFDVSTGRGAKLYRTGTIAWVGLAATKYDTAFDSSTYRATAERAAGYLLSLQGKSGLIRGGPELDWYSTQHNLLAYEFLGHLAEELKATGDPDGSVPYQEAAGRIAEAIKANLIRSDESGTRFIQGLDDGVEALDVQVLGSVFEQSIGDYETASAVLSYAQSQFAVADRSITESADKDSYNESYAAPGPFSGFRPYTEKSSPDLLWFEGTPMIRLAAAGLKQNTDELDNSINSWREVTGDSVGPLQANEALSNTAFGVEYHVWPAASAAAWVILAQQAPTFFTTY